MDKRILYFDTYSDVNTCITWSTSIRASYTAIDRGAMLPRTASSHPKRLELAVRSLLYCPACSAWQLAPITSGKLLHHREKRRGSTLVSATAVNATKSIPSRNRDIHGALIELGKKASGQVNLSRLQLAIQGLEYKHPISRIALLGLNVPITARRLVRLLLADSSKPQQEWEARFLAEDVEQTPGLLVRFGNPPDKALQASRSTLPILLIPAHLLQSQDIEILISSVNASDPGTSVTQGAPSDALLSPTVGTPASADGRQSLISQPVHRTIIVAHGIDELVSAAEILARTKFDSKTERKLVDIVADLNGRTGSSDSSIMTVDATRAEEGLQAVREALANAPDFEDAWKESGMSTVSKWLASTSAKSSVGLSPLLHDVIASLLEAAAANIASQAEETEATARSKVMTNESRSSLENAINAFSQQGHAELQSGLAAAWSSRNWRKLAFWKLPWRVDDVPLIVTDLITTAWLPRAERAVSELCGRMKQAGISHLSYPLPTPFAEPQMSAVPVEANAGEATLATINQPIIFASAASTESVSTPLIPPSRIVSKTGPVAKATPSLGSTISFSRQAFITTAITTLTSSAQQIVLKALTISGLSAAMSALSFLSVTSGSLYESATIVALGTAYAVRSMQREWEAQCRDLEDGLMEEGKSVLKQTEEHLRRLVKDASRVVEDEVELRARREAIEALEKAEMAFSKLR
jgi:chemotaxis protein histidine kinase CheA